MLTYALAIFTQREKRSMVRIGGIVCGFISICLLVIPETSLPNREAVPWIFVAALAPTCHAINNINVTRADMLAMTPIQIIYVANCIRRSDAFNRGIINRPIHSSQTAIRFTLSG